MWVFSGFYWVSVGFGEFWWVLVGFVEGWSLRRAHAPSLSPQTPLKTLSTPSKPRDSPQTLVNPPARTLIISLATPGSMRESSMRMTMPGGGVVGG